MDKSVLQALLHEINDGDHDNLYTIYASLTYIMGGGNSHKLPPLVRKFLDQLDAENNFVEYSDMYYYLNGLLKPQEQKITYKLDNLITIMENIDLFGKSINNPLMQLMLIGRMEKKISELKDHVLNEYFRKYNCEYKITAQNRSLGEKLCKRALIQLFPARKFYKINHKLLVNENTHRLLELDFYDGNKLAFEYNGKQHYKYSPTFHSAEFNFADQQKRDDYKIKLCEQNGIKLIIIPYTLRTVGDIIDYIEFKLKSDIPEPFFPQQFTIPEIRIDTLENIQKQKILVNKLIFLAKENKLNDPHQHINLQLALCDSFEVAINPYDIKTINANLNFLDKIVYLNTYLKMLGFYNIFDIREIIPNQERFNDYLNKTRHNIKQIFDMECPGENIFWINNYKFDNFNKNLHWLNRKLKIFMIKICQSSNVGSYIIDNPWRITKTDTEFKVLHYPTETSLDRSTYITQYPLIVADIKESFKDYRKIDFIEECYQEDPIYKGGYHILSICNWNLFIIRELLNDERRSHIYNVYDGYLRFNDYKSVKNEISWYEFKHKLRLTTINPPRASNIDDLRNFIAENIIVDECNTLPIDMFIYAYKDYCLENGLFYNYKSTDMSSIIKDIKTIDQEIEIQKEYSEFGRKINALTNFKLCTQKIQ